MEIKKYKNVIGLLIVIFGSLFAAVVTVQIPDIIGNLTDAFLNNGDIENCLLMLFFFLALSNLLTIINEYLTELIGSGYANRIREKLMDKFFTVNYGNNMEYKNGEYRQIFSNDVNNLQLMFSNTLPMCIQQSTLFVGSVYFLFYINKWLLICVLASTCIYIFPIKFFNRRQQQAIRGFRKSQVDLQGIVDNTSDNKEEIYQYDNIGFFSHIYNELQTLWAKFFLQIDVSKNFFKIFPRTLDAFSPALALLVGGVMIMNNSISIGQLVSVMGLISYINAPFKAFFTNFVDLQQAMISRKSINDYLQVPDSPIGPNEIKKVKEIKIFYKSKLIIRALSGMHIYLVGATGAGKTTFLRGLCGDQASSEYQYTFNGFLISKLKRESVKRQVSLVAQQHMIIPGTIRDNIFLSATSQLSSEEISFLESWIRKFPAGLDTKVGIDEKGAYQLSGGEQQVICILRSLAQASSVLLLDEITSSLDPVTAKKIRTLINQHTDTVIFESLHRTEEIKPHDKVIFFRGIHETPLFGNYDDLIGD